MNFMSHDAAMNIKRMAELNSNPRMFPDLRFNRNPDGQVALDTELRQIFAKPKTMNFEEKNRKAREDTDFFFSICNRMAKEIAIYRKQLTLDSFSVNSLKAQAKADQNSTNGDQFVPLVADSKNLVEPFFQVFDQKVNNYTNIFVQLDEQIHSLGESANELQRENQELIKILQAETEELVKFRAEGPIFDSDRATKKEILTLLEHKMKNLKQISEVYRHAQDKLRAAVDTKKKLLAEYKLELGKLDQKIKLLDADFSKKEEQMRNDEKTLTQLEQKFKAEADKAAGLKKAVKELLEKIRNAKVEIEILETRVADMEGKQFAGVFAGPKVDMFYFTSQLDALKARINQLNQLHRDKQNDVRTVKERLVGLEKELEEENKVKAEVNGKISKIRDSFNELKKLKSDIMEKRDKRPAEATMESMREDEKLKFTITSKNRELQEKARQQEEEIKLEFAKKEEAYSQEIRELEHKVSDLGSEAREKEMTIRKHKSDKAGFEEDLWETVNRLDPALAARKKKVEWSSEHIRELDERFNGAREKTDDQKKKILELASLKSEVEQLEFEKYRLDRQKAETIARKAQTKNLLESLRKVDPQSHLGTGPGPDLDWNTELQRAEQLLAVEKKKLQEATLSAQESKQLMETIAKEMDNYYQQRLFMADREIEALNAEL